MLLDSLQSLLHRVEGKDEKTSREMARRFFVREYEYEVKDYTELADLCSLPDEQRYLVSYPVVGHIVDRYVAAVETCSEQQKKCQRMLRSMIQDMRFANRHYGNDDISVKKKESIIAEMLKDPEGTRPIWEAPHVLFRDAQDVLARLPQKPKGYNTDIGHGVMGVFRSYTDSTLALTFLDADQLKPLGLSIMVVDDTEAQQWYERLMPMGFSGGVYHTDPEQALRDLEECHYDVILSDVELGVGKMDGVTFRMMAEGIVAPRNKHVRIVNFTHNWEMVEAINEVYRGIKRTHGLRDCYWKSRFNVVGFRSELSRDLQK